MVMVGTSVLAASAAAVPRIMRTRLRRRGAWCDAAVGARDMIILAAASASSCT